MNEPVMTLSGNVATDVRFGQTETLVSFARFRLACTPRRLDRAAKVWVDEETIWLSVSCWRSLADNVRESVRRGDPVVVTGRLRQRSWEKDGKVSADWELTADTVGHDLTRGRSQFRKVTRMRPAPSEESNAGSADAGVDAPPEVDSATGVDPETGEVFDPTGGSAADSPAA